MEDANRDEAGKAAVPPPAASSGVSSTKKNRMLLPNNKPSPVLNRWIPQSPSASGVSLPPAASSGSNSNNGTPRSMPRKLVIAPKTPPPKLIDPTLEHEDFDFSKSLVFHHDASIILGYNNANGAVVNNDLFKGSPTINPNLEKKERSLSDKKNMPAPNPLVPDTSSPWVQTGLDDFLKKIHEPEQKTTNPLPTLASSGSLQKSTSFELSSSMDSSGSSDSSDYEDEDEDDSLGENNSHSNSLVADEDDLDDEEDGSRRSHNPITADVLRLRAAKELEVLASLVPARVVHAHIHGSRPGPLRPTREEFDGAVLFADISGFSRLAEHLVRRKTSADPAETLTKYVGLNLHEMVEVICSRGGDVMKFAGDAILAVFAADQFGGSLPRAAVCCAQAALQLQTLELSAGDAKLSVHSGMGCGRVATYEVGGLQDRWEVFVAGPPVEQIGRCEPQAKPGELVVSSEARQCIEQISRVRGAIVEDGNFRLDKLLDPIDFPERIPVAKELSQLAVEDPDKAMELKRILQKYLSRPVIFSIEGHGQTLWGAELRVCSTLFCKFKGLKFINSSEEDLALVQYVVKNIVQKIMAELEGTVCRFMVDDKGAAMLLAFGLIPFCHANDSSRAVKAALLIRDFVAALSLVKRDNNLLAKRSHEEVLIEPLSASTLASSTNNNNNNNNHNHNEVMPTSLNGGDAAAAAAKNSSAPNTPLLKSGSSRKRSSSKYRNSSMEQNTTRTYVKNDDGSQPTVRVPVSCQIGITRGKVCVGMVGGSTRCEYTLHGVLVNRAARLMGSATDAVILCDQETYQEARNDVEFDVNPVVLRLKGERKQVKVYKPLHKAKSTKQRSFGMQYNNGDSGNVSANMDNLVGRHNEKAEVEHVFKQLLGEDPWNGVIGVQGDSGIGKSRILQYVARQVRAKGKLQVLSGFALDTEAATDFFAWKSIVYQIMSTKNPAYTPNPTQLHSVSSKETMTSYGSAQSMGSGQALGQQQQTVLLAHNNNSTSTTTTNNNYIITPGSPQNLVSSPHSVSSQQMKRKRHMRTSSQDRSPNPNHSAITISTPTAAADALQKSLLSPRNHSLNMSKEKFTEKKFEDKTSEERKECLIESLPLDKREMFPLFAKIVDDKNLSDLLQDNDATNGIAKEQRVQVTVETIAAMVSYYATTNFQLRGERLVIIMEDLQWFDRASLETLLLVVKSVPRLAVFCSGTYADPKGLTKRIPCDQVWDLPPLDKNEIARCMEIWVNVEKVSDSAAELIYERSNGNPLFAEELCRLMREKHAFEINNNVCSLKQAMDDSRHELPNSIIALMTQSLDRLDSSQQIVLRVAAVMGMQFTLHDIAGVLRVLNNRSSSIFYNKNGDRGTTLKFDLDDEKELTLEEMLKTQSKMQTSNVRRPP